MPTGSSVESPAIPGAAVADLRERLRGALVVPGDAAYDDGRRVWNAMIDKSPGAIARCVDVADVLACVEVARRHDVRVAVRGGGHNVAGNAVCDGGLVIDLASMRAVHVDPAGERVRVEPGAVLGDLDHATHPFGLSVPVGIVTATGVAGLTLGGGVGWLQRRYGLTIDNLLSVDVVTADGRLLRVSAGEHEDLFWGVRGGGGNFGVVTSFEFRPRPVSTVLGGALFYAPDDLGDFLRAYREFCADVPDELTADALLLTAPAVPFLPEAVHGRLIGVVALCWCGDAAEGERVLAPLRGFGPPVADLVQPLPFPALQGMFDEGNPPGVRHYWKSGFLQELSDELIGDVLGHVAEIPSPLSSVDFMLLGGAVARVGEDDTAFSHRDARFLMNISSDWMDAEEDDRQIAWTRAAWEAVSPATAGAGYVNYVAAERESQAATVYGERKYARLVEVKRAYDPDNFFSLNQNIDPGA